MLASGINFAFALPCGDTLASPPFEKLSLGHTQQPLVGRWDFNMTRHQRRKAAKSASLQKSEALAKASVAYDRQGKIRDNLSSPIRRKGLTLSSDGSLVGGEGYYPQSSMADMASQSHRGYVCKA